MDRFDQSLPKHPIIIAAVSFIFIMAFILIGLDGVELAQSQPKFAASPPPSARIPETPPLPPLELVALRTSLSSTGNYQYVEGQVRNRSSEPIGSLRAVATFYDKDDTFVTADDTLLDLNPLLPGQTSNFKIMTPYHAGMADYRIHFQQGGKIVEVSDTRKKENKR